MSKKSVTLKYFTGTGNSYLVLETCKTVFEENEYEVSISPITDKPPIDENSDCFGFCFPVHELGIPRIAKQYLLQLPALKREKRTFVFVTGGDEDDAGWALVESKKILQNKGYKVTNTELITMPNNWLPFDYVPSTEEAGKIIKNGVNKTLEAINMFISGQKFHKQLNIQKFGTLKSYFIYHIYRLIGIHRSTQQLIPKMKHH